MIGNEPVLYLPHFDAISSEVITRASVYGCEYNDLCGIIMTYTVPVPFRENIHWSI